MIFRRTVISAHKMWFSVSSVTPHDLHVCTSFFFITAAKVRSSQQTAFREIMWIGRAVFLKLSPIMQAARQDQISSLGKSTTLIMFSLLKYYDHREFTLSAGLLQVFQMHLSGRKRLALLIYSPLHIPCGSIFLTHCCN